MNQVRLGNISVFVFSPPPSEPSEPTAAAETIYGYIYTVVPTTTPSCFSIWSNNNLSPSGGKRASAGVRRDWPCKTRKRRRRPVVAATASVSDCLNHLLLFHHPPFYSTPYNTISCTFVTYQYPLTLLREKEKVRLLLETLSIDGSSPTQKTRASIQVVDLFYLDIYLYSNVHGTLAKYLASLKN